MRTIRRCWCRRCRACSPLRDVGIRQVVVHPLQRGRYYGHEQELFDMNMEFYRSLAPYAREAGVRIAIENMWQNHPVNGHIVDDVCANPHELAAYYDTLDDPDCFTVCLDLGHVALCAGGSRKMLCVSSVTIGWAHCTSMMWTT